MCWETAAQLDPGSGGASFGFGLQPFLRFLEHLGSFMRAPGGFGGSETHRNPEQLFLQTTLAYGNEMEFMKESET